MIQVRLPRRLSALLRAAFAAGAIGSMAGCGALNVTDPTRVKDEDLASEAGANLLRRDVLYRLYKAVGSGAAIGGIFSDEYFYDLPSNALPGGTQDLDRRTVVSDRVTYGEWSAVRTAAALAIPKLRVYTTAAGRNPLAGQALVARGYATLRLAEDYCPGFPLHEIIDYKPVYGQPLTTAGVFERALIDFDSALVFAADSAPVLAFARLARARALLGLGRFAEAGATVAAVPTDYLLNAEFSGTSEVFQPNPLFFPTFPNSIGVADREGGVGVDFVAASDPRVRTTLAAMAEDGVTGIYLADKYATTGAPVVIASGVEARLIEAEAALKAGGSWLAILNALRTDGTQTAGVWNPGTGGVAGLAPLTDPGTADAQADLLFRERAFWLYSTGHRLGDLRRLLAHYGRSVAATFPTGPYRSGGLYGTALSIPFAAELESPFNPAVVGCTGT